MEVAAEEQTPRLPVAVIRWRTFQRADAHNRPQAVS